MKTAREKTPLWMRTLQPLAWLLLPVRLLQYRLHKKNADTRLNSVSFRTRFGLPHPKATPATRLMAKWIAAHDLRQKSVLIAGAECGVLAVFAAQAGATTLAVDRDAQAVDLARENIRIHHFEAVATCSVVQNLSEVYSQRPFELICIAPALFSNIKQARFSDDLLLTWLKQAFSLLAMHGKLIFALHDDRLTEPLLASLRKTGYIFAEQQRKVHLTGFWHLIVLSKNETANT